MNSPDRIEALEKTRRRVLTGFLVTFLLWQIPTVIQDATRESLSRGAAMSLVAVAVLGALAWIAFGLRLALVGRTVRADAEAAAALEDERVQLVRGRSYAVGFWALLFYLVAVRVVSFATEPPSRIVAQLGLVVAVTFVISAFLFFDRE